MTAALCVYAARAESGNKNCVTTLAAVVKGPRSSTPNAFGRRTVGRELVDELRRFGRGDVVDGQPIPGPRLGSAGLPSGFRVVHETDDASRRS
jgi:hypothetical protein